MAEKISLKYSEINECITNLRAVNDSFYASAIEQLKESSDIGSTVMQAGWSFAKKEVIFDAIKNIKNRLERLVDANNDLIKILSCVSEQYESSVIGEIASEHSNGLVSKLKDNGFLSTAKNDMLISSISAYMANKKISSALNLSHASALPKGVFNVTSFVTNGVTIFNTLKK